MMLRSATRSPFLFLAVALAAGSIAEAQPCRNDVAAAPIFAGQHIDAGGIVVQVVGSFLCFTYNTDGNWLIEETHFAVADSLAGIPQTKKGNPKNGQFPYQSFHNPPVTTYTSCVAIEPPLPGDVFVVAAHASLVGAEGTSYANQQETGWAGEEEFPGKNWATYFLFEPLDCPYNE